MHSSSQAAIDYGAVARTPAFQELIARRRRFVTAALTVATLWFGTFVLLASYAHDFMATILVPGLSVAYLLGLSQFVLVWILTAAYLRSSTRVFEVLQSQIFAAGSAPRAGVR